MKLPKFPNSTPNFEIETFSAIRAVYEGDPSPVGILDIGAGTSKLAIVIMA